MNDGPASADVLHGVFPPGYRPYFAVYSGSLGSDLQPIADAFREAIACVLPAIRTPQPWVVVFGSSPFRIPLANGVFTYEARADVINVAFERMMLIDCRKVLTYQHPHRVATILEELVHVCLNTKDENLVTHIVGWLYPGIRVVNGQYALPLEG